MNGLVRTGKVDNESDWSFESSDGNSLLGEDNNWNKFSSVHLAINPEAEDKTKEKYSYPVAKLKNGELTVYRRGLIAAKAAAAGARGAEKQENIYNAADSLLKAVEKRNDSFEEVQRFDLYEVDLNKKSDVMCEKMKETSEGYLKGSAVITNIGVFEYMNVDGSVRRELRMPEDVFDIDSLESLKMQPISNNHPPERIIDSGNIKQHQVGHLGENIKTDNLHVSVPIVITDKETIEQIKRKGKRGLSAGYRATIEHKPGTYLGMRYDAIQRNIKYNHVAIVDRGRAGDAARLKIDSANNADKTAYRLIGDKINEEGIMPETLKKICIDGVDYQAEAEVIKAHNTEKKRADALQNNLSVVEAERDNYKSKCDQLEKELESVKLDDSKIRAAVQKKIDLLSTASKFEIDVKTDATDTEIRKAVILAAFPDAKLDGKDDLYLEGRFDGAVEILNRKKDNEGRTPFIEIPDGSEHVDSAEDARRRMVKRLTKKEA